MKKLKELIDEGFPRRVFEGWEEEYDERERNRNRTYPWHPDYDPVYAASLKPRISDVKTSEPKEAESSDDTYRNMEYLKKYYPRLYHYLQYEASEHWNTNSLLSWLYQKTDKKSKFYDKDAENTMIRDLRNRANNSAEEVYPGKYPTPRNSFWDARKRPAGPKKGSYEAEKAAKADKARKDYWK